MTYQGYMALANDAGETIELVNAARVKAYTDNLAPSIGLRGCDDCEGLDAALGETYTNPTDDFAPWYDPTDAATAGFYGVYPLAFEGIDDSTRSIVSEELTGDGSVVVGSRFTGKDIRVTGVAFAADEASLYAGVSWLDNALNGTEDGRCFGDRLNLYSSCPAVETFPPDFATPYTLVNPPSAAELAAWTTTSGTITGDANGVNFLWTTSDGLKTACRGITGLIPGEQYQLRLRLETFGDYFVSVGPACAERYENLFPDPRLTATTMTTNGATVVDTRPSTGAPDGGSYFNRLVVAANTSTPMTMPLSGTGTSASPVVESNQYTASWYEKDVLSNGTAMILDGAPMAHAWTPDAASLDIVGDLDLRAHIAPQDWTPAARRAIVAKWNTTGNQRSYILRLNTTGTLSLFWSTNGTATMSATSTVAPTVVNREPLWVRATLDVNNGAAGNDVIFYTSTDGSTWTQLGATVTQAGVTSIFAGTARLTVGAHDDGASERLMGSVFAARVRNGIAGPVVANPDFNAQAAGTTSFVDAAGLTWTLQPTAVIGEAPAGARVDWTWYDGTGAVISSETGTPHTGAAAGWNRFTQTMTAPATAAYVQVSLVRTGYAAVGEEITLAQAQLNRGSTALDYIDGDYPDANWEGTPNASSSLVEENVDYETIFGWATDHNPPTEPTVLDFIPRDSTVYLSIQPTDTEVATPTLNLQVQQASVRRIAHPGVVAFGTGDDAVPPSDGWTHLAPATMSVTWTLDARAVSTLGRAPAGSALTYTTAHGVQRTLYGLNIGSRYRLMVEFQAHYTVTGVSASLALAPVIDVGNASAVVTTYSNDNVGTFQYFRVVEFTATATSSSLLFHPTSNLSLGSSGSVTWQFDEYMVEEILDTDTTPPQAGRFQERTMYEVKASQGPILTNVRTSPCGVMGQITYSLRAGNPFKYRSPVFAGGLPAGPSETVVDVTCSDGLPQIVNFMYNPSVETNATNWVAAGTGVTQARTASATAIVGGFLFRATAPNTVGNSLDTVTVTYLTATAATGPTPQPGETLTVSMYVRAITSGGLLQTGLYPYTVFITMSGFPSISINGSVNVVAGDTWYRLDETFTLPLNVALTSVDVQVATPVAYTQGGGLETDGFMLQRGTTATTVFDETDPNAVWSGTANASAVLLNQVPTDISADPDCPTPPTPPGPPTIDEDCITQPDSYSRTVVEIPDDTVPRNLTAYPVITLVAGSADVRQARIRFWENPSNLTIDQLDPCAYVGEIIVSYLAAGATMVIDGVLHEATISLPGYPDQNANHVLYGPDGGPVFWPELSGGIPYLVTLELDSSAPYTDTLMTIDLVVRD